ncbi:hypothetical protein AOC36_06890 [Erysipelothrix larvae]|uniref:Leucine-rich repeat domain-containing protein n=1 Tax=Erysipelothrix larvae TaxID=1514105 RepID=A0A0X8H0B0_9FIRM|nr:leucine-rich repeat domain-containing protein [Erysipelothrix larvae]AMC93717.1 hypothetical protein AOC36_06890 [Erysipelothrix larvae]
MLFWKKDKSNAKDFNYDNNGKMISILGYKGSKKDGKLVIPSKIEGLPVEEIGEEAFRESNFSEIVLPSTLRIIRQSAFESCSKLISMIIPNSVKQIDSSAFCFCKSLESIVFPDGLQEISSDMCKFDDALRKVILPDSITAIHWGAFNYCFDLDEVRLPVNIQHLGNDAFDSFTAFTNSSEISQLVVTNGISASIVGAEHVEAVNSIFDRIDHSSYSRNKTIKSIVITEKTKLVEYQSFMHCTALERVEVMGKHTILKENCFSECRNLETLILASFTNITADTLKNCNPNIIFKDSRPPNEVSRLTEKQEIKLLRHILQQNALNVLRSLYLDYNFSKLSKDDPELVKVIKKAIKDKKIEFLEIMNKAGYLDAQVIDEYFEYAKSVKATISVNYLSSNTEAGKAHASTSKKRSENKSDIGNNDQKETEAPEIIEEDTLEDIEEDTLEDIEEDTLEDIEEDTLEDIEEDTLEDIEEDTLEDIEEDTLEDIEEDTLEDIEEDTLEDIEEDTLEDIEEDTLEDIEEDTLEDIEEDTLEDIEEDTLEDIEEDTLEDIEGDTPKDIEKDSLESGRSKSIDEVQNEMINDYTIVRNVKKSRAVRSYGVKK